MIGVAWWQALLDGLGWLLAQIYEYVPNYGVAIILLTVGIRVVLLPLGIKQIRSMHAMQALQPKVKALQTKYKGNRQKLNEETMKVYREAGVNPFSGCWPMLLQIPILIALYSVLRFPQQPVHLPLDSQLWGRIETQLQTGEAEGTDFLWMNMLCSPIQAGQGEVEVAAAGASQEEGEPSVVKFACGDRIPIRIPYYVLALLMIGTTYYQQKQMQKASPPGASAQQQALTRFMPLLFGVWGFIFPAGLVLYWTTSNGWQIGQQHFILKAKREALGETAVAERGDGKRPGRAVPAKGSKAASPTKKPQRTGLFQSMLDRAEQGRARKRGQSGAGPKPSGSSPPSTGRPSPSGGKRDAGSRKKRRKR